MTKKLYKIAVSWTETGTILIESNDIESAIKMAERTINDIKLPEGEYLDESFQIDKDTTRLLDSMKKERPTRKMFGNPIVGTWFCPVCSYQIYPNSLEKSKDSFTWSNSSKSVSEGFVGPHCKKCGTPMEYDEEV